MILTQLAHERAPFRNPAMKSRRKPQIQLFAMSFAQHLEKLLHEQLCTRQVRMNLANTHERLSFLLRPFLGAFQEQTDGSMGSHFDPGGKNSRKLPLLFQVT